MTVALFVEGLLGEQHPVDQSACVAGQRDAGLDRGHPAGRSSASRCANGAHRWDRPQAIPISASRCSAKPVREIRPVRLIVADW